MDDIYNKHSITICSKCDVKIRKVKQTKSNVMVQNLKDSASAAAHLWTECNSEKKDESNNFDLKLLTKIKKTIYFSYLILTLWMTFITNIQ